MLDAELLEAVRAAGLAAVTYEEPPARLGGGFFTENYAFRLAGAEPPWDGELVVRLFPSEAPPDLAHREAAVQRELSAQGYPAPPIVWFDDDARISGRRCFVMQRLVGHPLIGGIRPRDLLKSPHKVYRQLIDMTAAAQAWLHRLDATPLVDALAGMPVGVDRWFGHIAEYDGLAAGSTGSSRTALPNGPIRSSVTAICTRATCSSRTTD